MIIILRKFFFYRDIGFTNPLQSAACTGRFFTMSEYLVIDLFYINYMYTLPLFKRRDSWITKRNPYALLLGH